jgi:hypothetical protein
MIYVHWPNEQHIKLRHTDFITVVEKSFDSSESELKKKKDQFAINILFKTLDPTHRLILIFMAQHPLEGKGLVFIQGFTIIFRHHNLYDSSGRVISPTQTSIPDNTRHSQETDFHAPGRIRTRNPSTRATANPRLKPRGHRDNRRLIR